MYKSLSYDRTHRSWCLQKSLMMCSLYTYIYYVHVLNDYKQYAYCKYLDKTQ